MSSGCRSSLTLGWALACLLAGGCQREHREFAKPAQTTSPPSQTAMTPLVAGTTDPAFRAQQTREYGENAYQLTQGQTLYSAFNCVGCHAHGGGDVGPPLMDDKWIYGAKPDQIYATISQGRPDGMPSFGGHLPTQQIWQLVAYVQAMSGQVKATTAPGRNDDQMGALPESRQNPQVPIQTGHR